MASDILRRVPAIAIIFRDLEVDSDAVRLHLQNLLILLIGLIELLARNEELRLRQLSFDRIHAAQRLDLPLGGFFASAHDARRVHQIANQVPLRLQIVRIQPHRGLEFAVRLVRQRQG